MTNGLKDLLERMREHPSFPELLKAVEPPDLKRFRLSADSQSQKDEFVFRSGRIQQHELWQEFLTKFPYGEASQQEKS